MIDVSKRYDVYCKEGDREVVYRNVLFRTMKNLFPKHKYDVTLDFIELEEADGQTVFVSRYSVTKFREHLRDPKG